ncbi:MAG: hypothetical protein IJN53_07410 [Oscillospiraceae bacterium]|nr:hypothetical protein [Oscillospiraceae bacterium]
MYKGKYEAPKGSPKPRRPSPRRRIEDVPFRDYDSPKAAAAVEAVAAAAAREAQQAAAAQNAASAPAAQNAASAPAPEKAAVNAAVSAAPVLDGKAASREEFLLSLQQEQPLFAEPETDASASPSDKLVSMDTLSLRRAGAAPAQGAAQKQPQRAAQSAPQRRSSAKNTNAKKAKKKTTTGTKIFYGIYFAVIILCFALLAGALRYLDTWLVGYEKSQPKAQSQAVFDANFADPDWGKLYDQAGLEDTAYEGKDAFVSYMQALVGDGQLRYVATASGDPESLSKYLVKLDDTRIASFTLSAKEGKAGIKQWELSEIDIPIKRQQSVSVKVGPGQTVYVNGVALTDAHILRTTVTLAEEYLPEGVFGYSATEYYLDGLLVAPQVTVTDASGAQVALSYDAAANCYSAPSVKPEFTMTDQQRSAAIAAAKVLSEFRIEVKDRTALSRHFDKNSDYYKATVGQDTWMQNNLLKSYTFSDPVVSEYYEYSEDLFSVHVDMTLIVTRTNGTIKEWDASGTFFFSKRSDGSWIVTDTNKIRLQQEVTKVRLTYVNDGQTLAYELVDATSVQLEPPQVAVPEGKQFAGWYREAVDENGKTVLQLAFQVDPTTGLVYLGTGVELEPMVLHARFEDAGGQ